MGTKTRPSIFPAISIEFDSLVGAGGGLTLVSCAQQLPDGNFVKSLLIFLAPPLTLVIKFLWLALSPLVFEEVKNFLVDRKRGSIIFRIDALLQNGSLDENIKATLRKKKVKLQLAMVDDRLSQLATYVQTRQLKDEQ